MNQLKKVNIFHSFNECDKEVRRLKLLQQRYPLCPDVIPPELADLDQWVVWSYEVRQWKNGAFGPTKTPYQAKNPNLKASKTVSSDWSDLKTALWCVENNWHPIDGIGFVFSREDGFSGVDFDNCRNPETHHIREEYQFWIDKLGGYAEVSPSGTGVKVWVKGTIADKYFTTERSTGFRILKFAGGEIEVYRRGQYFTVTTQCLKKVEFIASAQRELDVLSEWSLSEVSRDLSYNYSSVPTSTEEDTERKLSPPENSDRTSVEGTRNLGTQPTSSTHSPEAVDIHTPSTLQVTTSHLMDPRCSRCGRKCNQHYELCYECYNDGEPEVRVEEAVFNYFSKFHGFSAKRQQEIRIGTYTPRPDVVLLDWQGNLAAIAECKRGGIVGSGIDQLKSYLTASDVQFGVFANSTEPDKWIFFENLRGQHFKESIPRPQFEAQIVAYRSIESISEEKKRLITEVEQAYAQHEQKTRELESSYKRLDDLNEKIKRKNKQFAQIKEEVVPLRKESSDLKEENTRLKGEITQNSKRAKVVEGLKLESTHDSLRKSIDLLSSEKDQLQNEIGTKEQQRWCLSKKINLLREDEDKLDNLLRENTDKLKRAENKVRSERETLEREKKIWKDGEKERKNYNDYLEQINAKLEKSIKHKNDAVRDLDRLSRLDELEAAFAQESIYEQIREELERLDKLELEINSKQQLARRDQERHAVYKRNKVETNQKIQKLAQVSEEKESILKQLRVVVNQLKTASSEQQASQIEKNRKQLVRDFQERKCIRDKLIKEISRLKEVKSELEEEIRQAGQQLPFEENEVCPAYVQIQLEIDELKTEQSKIEAKIGHQIFLDRP